MSKPDAFSTLELLNNCLRVFGLSYIYRDGSNLKHNCPIWKLTFYSIVFIAATAFNCYIKYQTAMTRKKIAFTDSIQGSYLLSVFLYIVDVAYVYKYGRDVFIDYFKVYDTIDSILGIPSNNKIRKCIRNMYFSFTIVAILTIAIELYTWTINFNWILLHLYLTELLYLLIKMVAVLDLISNLVQVKYRLEVLGDLLEYCDYQTDRFPRVKNEFTIKAAWTTQEGGKSKHRDLSQALSVSCPDIISHLSKCYMLLTDQSEFINLKYGIRILASCSIYLLDMVVLLNMAIRILMGNLVLENAPNDLLLLSTLGRILNYTIILFCQIRQCEHSYRQMERILRYINQLLINKKIGNETREMLTTLKGVITSRPVNYHGMNFFRLDYTTIVSLASVIVTYTIILLQNLQ